MNKPDRMERIAARFQAAIGKMAADYETKLVMQADEYEEEIEQLKAELRAAKGETVSE